LASCIFAGVLLGRIKSWEWIQRSITFFWPFQTTIAPFTNIIDCSNHYIHVNAPFLVFLFWINREVNDPEWAWRKNVRKTNTTLSEPYEYVRSVSIHKIKFWGELLPTEATRLKISALNKPLKGWFLFFIRIWKKKVVFN
jgi:hypothetical protein